MIKNAKLFWLLLLAVSALLATVLKADDKMEYISGPGVSLATNSDGTVTISGHVPSPQEYAEWRVERMREEGSLANILNVLLSKGEVCKARGGHIWDRDMLGGVISAPAVNNPWDGPKSSSRKCVICGLAQTKTESPWQ